MDRTREVESTDPKSGGSVSLGLGATGGSSKPETCFQLDLSRVRVPWDNDPTLNECLMHVSNLLEASGVRDSRLNPELNAPTNPEDVFVPVRGRMFIVLTGMPFQQEVIAVLHEAGISVSKIPKPKDVHFPRREPKPATPGRSAEYLALAATDLGRAKVEAELGLVHGVLRAPAIPPSPRLMRVVLEKKRPY